MPMIDVGRSIMMDGAHQLFMRFKFNTAVLLWLLPSLYLSAQVVGEFTGTLIMGYIDKTNLYSVSLLSSSSNWDLTLAYSNIVRETFYDGNQTVWIIHFPQASRASNSENTVELKLFPDSRPVDLRPEEHVWMALFSGESLVSKKTPLTDIGLCISERCIFTRLESKTTDASPREALWHNTRSDDTKTSKIAGEFRWDAWTSLENGIVVPTESDLAINVGSKTVTHSKLVLTAINPLTAKPRTGPKFEGKGLVYDYRAGNLEHRQRSEFIINNDEMPPINSEVVKKPRRVINASVEPQVIPKRPARTVVIVILLLSPALIAVLYKLNKKQK